MFPATLLMGCPGGQPDATIHTSQLGVCTTTGKYTAPANTSIVLFRINQVDNTQVGNGWTFNEKAFLTDPPSACQYDVVGSDGIQIAAKTAVPINKVIGIIVQASGSAAANVNYTLLYGNSQPPDAACQGSLNISVPSGKIYQVPTHPGTLTVSDAAPGRTVVTNCGQIAAAGP